MSKANTIHNDSDADDIVRALNKHSGGWAAIVSREVPILKRRTETWTATLSVSDVDGVVVTRARKDHCQHLAARDLPKHVREYLLINDDTKNPMFQRSTMTREEFDALEAGGDITRVRVASPSVRLVTFKIDHQPTVVARGVEVGCEVGDSGSGPTEFVPFPTTEKALSEAMDRVVSYAGDLEIETGWRDADDDDDSPSSSPTTSSATPR